MATTVAELVARLRADTSDFTRGVQRVQQDLRGAESSMRRFGNRATDAGRSLRPLSLAAGAAAAASVKMAADFESSLTKMTSLVGVSADQVAGFRDEIMALAGETARAPQELADAMFFITSAGLEGADALDALEQSAKTSAVGLGDTATVADLVTSAMNAYGPETLNAAAATDTLIAAVREGKAEAPELAAALGRVLPIASAMGVSFDQVGAAVAAMTRTGTNAREAVTQLRSILTGVLQPSRQAEEAMNSLGLSSEGLRQTIRDDGLLTALQQIIVAFDGNADATAAVFGNVRALSGVMDLLGSNAEATEDIFASMTDTVGLTDTAFETVSQTAQFQFSQAMSDLKAAATELGTTLLPIATDIANGISTVASAFAALPDPVQKAAGALLGIAAVAAPTLIAIGSVARAIDSINTVWPGALKGIRALAGRAGFASLGAAAGAAAAVILGVKEGIDDFNDGMSEGRTAIQEYADELREAGVSADEFNERIGEKGGLVQSLKDIRQEFMDDPLGGIWENVRNPTQAFGELIGRMREAAGMVDDGKRSWHDLGGELGKARDKMSRTADEAGNVAQAQDDAARATDNHRNAAKNLADELRANTDPFFALIDATNGVAEAQAAFADEATTENALAVAEALTEQAAAAKDLVAEGANLDQVIRFFRQMVIQGRLTDDQFNLVVGTLREMNELSGSLSFDIDTNAREAAADINNLLHAIDIAVATGSSTVNVPSPSPPSGPTPPPSTGGVGTVPSAHGGTRIGRGVTLVGERGPELLMQPAASTVVPLRMDDLAAGMSPGQAVSRSESTTNIGPVTVVANDPRKMEREIRAEARRRRLAGGVA